MKKFNYCLFILLISLVCNIQQTKAQTEKRLRFIDSMINVFPKQKTDSAKGYLAMNIAQQKMGAAQNTGNWDEAIEWADKGVYYSKKGNFKFGIRRCNWMLGRCWMLKGNYPEAIRYFNEMLNAVIKEDLPKPIVTACNWIGDCYMQLGKYQEALKTFQTGLTICEKRSAEIFMYEQDRAGLILKIGDLYVNLKKYPEAVVSYKKLLDFDSDDSTGAIHAKIALAQIELKNYDEAQKNLQIAVRRLPSLLNRKAEIQYKGILGSFLLQIGEAYCKLGSVQKNAESLQSYLGAINYLNKCVSLLKEGAGGTEALMNAYALLKEACEATSDYQNALLYSNLYTQIKDSLFNKETYVKLTELEVNYKTEKAAAVFQVEQEKEKLRNAALLANEKAMNEQNLEKEKAIAIAGEKANYEKTMAIAGEKANYEKTMAVEKIRNEKQQANNLLLMGLIIVVMASVFLYFYLRQRHEKKRAVEKVETIHQMAELEMQSLRSQLNPHFMFNSLNSIQTMIMKEQTDKSQTYLSRFARLLRMLLENADKQFIPLRMEMEFLQLYLSLEGLRVPDMQYSISTDPELNTEQILIPNMILQPYVENAIWHGLSHKQSDKQLQIRVSRENGIINYEIEDNGVGRKKAGELKSVFRQQHQSKGMELISKRIELLNKEYSSVIQTEVTDIVKDMKVSGTLVCIKVPVTLHKNLQS